MAQSSIEWTGKVWNPVTGCNKVSQGCKNCYAEGMHKRLKGMGQAKYQRDFLDGAFPHEESLLYPLSIKKPTTFFVNSMSDLFHEMIPDEYIEKVFAVMALCPQHTFQVLTKREIRMQKFLERREDSSFFEEHADIIVHTDPHLFYNVEYRKFEGERMPMITNEFRPHIKSAGWFNDVRATEFGKDSKLIYEGQYPLPNVWLGVSVEDNKTKARIINLSMTPAHIRFVSMEPMLEDIELTALDGVHLLDWIIVGGESGPRRRPFNADWARNIKEWCWKNDVAFFMKQIDKVIPVPEDLMIRELPRKFINQTAEQKI